MNSSARIVLFALVFALSTLFFWNAINGYLIKSRADDASLIKINPFAEKITCNPRGTCMLPLAGATLETNGVAGVSGAIRYGDNLKPLKLEKSPLCEVSDFGLDSELRFKDDSGSKTLYFAVGSLEGDEKLVGGVRCITSIVFQPINVSETVVTQSSLSLAPQDMWKVGGRIGDKRGSLTAEIDTKTFMVSIDPSVPMEDLPRIPSPGSCIDRPSDCNCDGKVDLVDFEMLRSHVYDKVKMVCDPNGDGVGDAKDFSTWLDAESLLGN